MEKNNIVLIIVVLIIGCIIGIVLQNDYQFLKDNPEYIKVDTTYNTIVLDSIKYNIQVIDSTIYKIQEEMYEEVEKTINADDSTVIKQFIKLASE